MISQNTLFIIIVLIALALPLEWYTYRGIRMLTRSWPLTKKRLVRRGYWVLLTGLVVCLIVTFQQFSHAHRLNDFSQATVNATLTMIATQLAFMLVLFAEDIYRLVASAICYFQRRNEGSGALHPRLAERRKWVSQVALAVAGAPFVSFVYGITKGKYDYRVRRQVLYFDDLPESFDGFTITQVSDIHSGSFDNRAAVQRGVDLALAQESALFVFTGDLVNYVAEEIVPWLELLGQLRAPYGQFSILGNHDYGEYITWDSEAAKEANLTQLIHYHDVLGYQLLNNTHVILKKGGQTLALLGVENWGRGFIQRGDLDAALAGVDDEAFKVLLSHDPSHWEVKVKNHPTLVQLTLSGHTHRMQMGVELPGWKWSPIQYRYPHWAGLAEVNHRKLYVNRGFGFIGFSGRVGIWPEITVLELRRGES